MRRRALFALSVAALAALLLPAAARAHTADVEYRFPLPVWLYALAAGIAVLASAPAAAFAVRRPPHEESTRNLYPLVHRFDLGRVGLVVTTVLLVVALAGGLFGDRVSFTANPAPLLVWVVFWVGLGIVSALVGNVWDFISPLNAAGRRLDRMLARRDAPTLPYPDWLGVWPSVLLLLAWSWMELIWESGGHGRPLALVLLVYLALQLVGMALFGAELWLARCELFTVFARTFARFAPLELYVTRPQGDCRAARCEAEGEHVGCPSCWLDAEPEDRGLRLRPYGSGVRREPPLGEGGGAFVVALLATVVFDGFRSTVWYRDLVFALDPRGYTQAGETVAMILVVGGFVVAFVIVCAVVSLAEEGGLDVVARRYAPTLVPIAAVYFIAHYFLYFVYLSQLTPTAVADPFDRGWVGDYSAWSGVPGVVVWYLQVGLIVWGHVVAVLEAHRVSITVHRRPQAALVAQLPLVLLMVGYTFTGLWVLGQALRAI